MNRTAELEHLRAKLDSRRRQIEENETGSRSTKTAQRNGSKASSQRELTEIEKALQRFRMGMYGVCSSCGGAISTLRLCAMPSTEFCVECYELETKTSAPTNRVEKVSRIGRSTLAILRRW